MQQMRPEERREFQRLHLTNPIQATLGEKPMQLVEIGILGARMQHNEKTAAEYADLWFKHNAKEIGMKCEIVRANMERQGDVTVPRCPVPSSPPPAVCGPAARS
jgi:hypothetical protein